MANHEAGRLPDSDDRETPDKLFSELNRRFRFDLDAAASHENTKCPVYCTLIGTFTQPVLSGLWVREPSNYQLLSPETGLAHSWRGRRVWCNPPYSDIEPWILRAWQSRADMAYLLAPNWTDRGWWRTWIEDFRDGRGTGTDVEEETGMELRTEFMGRQRFLYKGEPIRTKDGKIGQPEFGLVGLIFTRKGT
jgi:phage N-6-adenine-methyltransferase